MQGKLLELEDQLHARVAVARNLLWKSITNEMIKLEPGALFIN